MNQGLQTAPRRSLEQAPQSKRGLVAGAVACALAAGGGAAWHVYGNSSEQISAVEGRVALGIDDERALTAVERASAPDVYLHVVLEGVPSYKKLALRCDWVDPSGVRARVNHYRTRLTDKPRWRTHCHQRFSDADPAGEWSVALSLADRVVSTQRFVLRP